MVAQQEDQITFEELAQLDKKFANADFVAEHDTADVATDVAGKLRSVCAIYRQVKPVIGIIASIPFIPSNVKNAVKAFTRVLDTVC